MRYYGISLHISKWLKMDLKHQKESMKWIGSNLFILSTKDVILYGASINTINESGSMIILTNSTGSYDDSPLITNNNYNDNHYKSNYNKIHDHRTKKKETKYSKEKGNKIVLNIWKWNNINEIWYTYNTKRYIPQQRQITITTNHCDNIKKKKEQPTSVWVFGKHSTAKYNHKLTTSNTRYNPKIWNLEWTH